MLELYKIISKEFIFKNKKKSRKKEELNEIFDISITIQRNSYYIQTSI